MDEWTHAIILILRRLFIPYDVTHPCPRHLSSLQYLQDNQIRRFFTRLVTQIPSKHQESKRSVLRGAVHVHDQKRYCFLVDYFRLFLYFSAFKPVIRLYSHELRSWSKRTLLTTTSEGFYVSTYLMTRPTTFTGNRVLWAVNTEVPGVSSIHSCLCRNTLRAESLFKCVCCCS